MVVNGTVVNPDDAFRKELKARLAGGLPVLVVHGTAGAPNEVAARSALGKLITNRPPESAVPADIAEVTR